MSVVAPPYEAKYHTHDEMAAYLTAWTSAFRTHHFFVKARAGGAAGSTEDR